MNVDPSKSVGNGPIVGSVSTSSKPYLANGGCKERITSFPNNDTSFPPEGFPSLKLPTVVVFIPTYRFLAAWCFGM